ncbi:hypothetical protein [Mesorhizobium sp. M0895]|uniref:hypothetical protein n=1 Tax=Mesorhizobium sp. M0895 TaxID=2957019 RepID=UPI0033380F7B
MGIARSTYYDRPEKAADDTAIVEAIFATATSSSSTVIAASALRCVSKASS